MILFKWDFKSEKIYWDRMSDGNDVIRFMNKTEPNSFNEAVRMKKIIGTEWVIMWYVLLRLIEIF